MKITRHSVEYDIDATFPDAREIHLAEGACVYASEMQGKYFIIIDSRTTLDFLDEQDREDLAGEIVAVYEFATNADRSAYLKTKGISKR